MAPSDVTTVVVPHGDWRPPDVHQSERAHTAISTDRVALVPRPSSGACASAREGCHTPVVYPECKCQQSQLVGRMLLHACGVGHLKCVSEILRERPDLINLSACCNSYTPLDFALCHQDAVAVSGDDVQESSSVVNMLVSLDATANRHELLPDGRWRARSVMLRAIGLEGDGMIRGYPVH